MELKLIVDKNVSGYIKSFEKDLREELAEIEEYGIKNEVPIIKKDAQSLLRFAIKSFKPEQILEIGTAIGFSSCLMAEYMPASAKIHTIEKMPERIEIAKSNIKKTGNENKITVLEGDASEILTDLSSKGMKFDFVFMDAAKAQYPDYFAKIDSMLTSGGILLADNILQEGSVAESKFSVPRRERTIHIRMREFLSIVMNSSDYNSVIVPIGDGMLLCTKN
jgi:predicted O-methyltransferase YrrM